MAETRPVHLLLRGASIATGILLALGLAGTWLGAGGAPLLRAGLIVLVLTPVARVLVLAVQFARAGEWSFAAASGAVLALLALGAALGAAG